jgi:hypothetical protein
MTIEPPTAMNVCINITFIGDHLTDWHFTIRSTFHGEEYASTCVGPSVSLTKDGQPITNLPAGLGPRFNAMALAVIKSAGNHEFEKVLSQTRDI